MNTDINLTVWLEDETEATVHVGGRTAWVGIGDNIVLHSLTTHAVGGDLDRLEAFFTKGLIACQVARQEQLLKDLCGG